MDSRGSTSARVLTVVTLPGSYSIIRAAGVAEVPDWFVRPPRDAVAAVLWSDSELSIIVRTDTIPRDSTLLGRSSDGWRCLRLDEVFDLDQPGVLDGALHPLAEAGVSVMAVASFDTDHLFVRDLDRSLAALAAAGHRINRREERRE